MKLITKEIERHLLENGGRSDEDHRQVVKLFNLCGAATWLFTQMDPDGSAVEQAVGRLDLV